MAYLIPKSARNVKIQLFKGLGIVEAVIVIIAILLGFVLLNIFGISPTVFASLAFLSITTVFLVSPSFLINKKGYQVFEVLLTYYYQQKDFINRKKVRADAEKNK